MRELKALIPLMPILMFGLLVSGTALAAEQSGQGTSYQVTITNLTKKQVLTPPLVFSHTQGYQLFMVGQAASDALVAVAEGGDLQPLLAELGTRDDVHDSMAASGPILPGMSQTLTIAVKGKASFLSLVGMLATSNDGFFALKGFELPRNSGRLSLALPAYDAGSEANTELCSDVPGPPCDNGSNQRVTEGAEGFVYIHNGIHGSGDLSAANMDWHNPVVLVVIEKVSR